jgi:hypothetical protein
MDKRQNINKKNQVSLSKNPTHFNILPTPTTPDYDEIHERYKILCNNSIRGGDCYGQTMCACKCFLYDKNYHKYYNREPSREDLHHDFTCNNCFFHICGCCFTGCPKCSGFDITQIPW